MLKAESMPGPYVRPEGLSKQKIPMTPSGIERTTFQLTAQGLNNCTTTHPLFYI